MSHYNLKQLVKFSTRGERILDLVLTNLKDYYKEPSKLAPFGLSDHCTIFVSPHLRTRHRSTKKTVITRDMRPSSRDALGRFFNTVDWSLIDTMDNAQDKLKYFMSIINIGLNTIMPTKLVKLHRNDVPWMTGQLKLLIRKRQEALNQSNPTLFRFYRNKVNKERKVCRSKYYQTKVKDLSESNPKMVERMQETLWYDEKE